MGIFAPTPLSSFVFDFVASGCVITADSAGVNKNYSMTAGTVYIGGIPVTVAAVSAQTVAASKDRYIDVDNTGTLTNTEVNNNAVSPALAANSIRLGIVVAGATTIANVGSINQGQETKVLPIASSTPYQVTESLGNLIYPTDPNRKTLGYRQILSDVTSTTVTTFVDVTGLLVPFIVPAGRKTKATLFQNASGGNGGMTIAIRESTTTLNRADIPGTTLNSTNVPYLTTASSGLHTYLGSMSQGSAGTMTFRANTVYPAFLLIELN